MAAATSAWGRLLPPGDPARRLVKHAKTKSQLIGTIHM
jgi:hypothetical protein